MRHGTGVTRRWSRAIVRAVALMSSLGCGLEAEHEAARLAGGNPAHGPAAMRRYGCTSCHVIPGVRGAEGRVGPPLQGIADRSYVAGVIPNSPENLVRWIRDPQSIDSLTAMPNTGVTEVDARDIASYLYTLR